jgi:hypothetical protein
LADRLDRQERRSGDSGRLPRRLADILGASVEFPTFDDDA